ncbi:similar to Saccharomyces cerevisiae YLR409C UTP21 Subunit of U3-containing 90S preribosome and Small Subunit (SSU) processome complexes [Maudiozyma barnettii]|uniref:Similar to Saccharomyces cerevisiae YLR409C UTP21 Subunit of U3-containing 90S preribosome and Small Subunit (SSU) processome complexes n=1 Tax=Maudiozyma barnettii TaxID=61262 RepID=A0A8H2ZHV2_9SACH|nr:rRNA-processing protein UTP21 [Kazachstania barnettii]CAB4256179.1 similar to Saccharomyces cerevisiae YLR409C UTP21 Subunit of U3-containing 90S preribosome and Small Subunit (SSU) processome complexes [Kazachstania barnettii]CAD1784787.1 similar to Saccharomyces cerevisiae YLR409C UTP21 Subunit of U3-containing 90S preribosome and Small Subunit (SSU) processome complexes [Kazachstania barnettii]
MNNEVAKKRKLELVSSGSGYASRIFAPFRIVGNVSNGTPYAIGTLGSTFYIVTSVGKSFQIYDANNLHLLFVSEKETESNIVALATHYHYVFASYDNKIGVYKRGIQEHCIELDSPNAVIRHICNFGDYLCVSTDENIVYIYKKSSPKEKYATKFYTKLQITKLQGGDIVSIIHLPTYLNKLVVVTKSNVILYNIRSGKLIFTSDEFPDQITTCEQAPALDIIALGTVTGDIIMYNLRKGKKIRTIKVPQLRISSISFRTDGSSHICIGGTNGDLVFYDLERRSRIHVLKGVHGESMGGVTKASFLNGQAIVVTSGGDNSLKEYVFDPSLSQGPEEENVVQPPRFLRSRGGHSQPPSRILFADDESHFLLSASRDRSLWGFSLRKDAQSQELSQRLHKKNDGNRVGGSTIKGKFEEIVSMAIENTRLGEWENVITAHKNEKFARTWDMRNKRVGRWTFKTTDDGFVKSVALSQCGNFGFVGSSNGDITVYNMQSGIIRKKYRLHKNAAVTGIELDGMNRKMVSCGLDGLIGFYDFNKSTLLGKLQLDAPITRMVYHRSSDLFAVALDDFSIVVVDSVTQRVVRQLWGHNNRITAFDFSPDGRWIVSASLDSTMRTWDLPTGGCIDGVKLDSIITDLKFSSNGDMLATTHVTGNGICMWTNRAQFKAISTRMVDEEEFQKIQLPNASVSGNSSVLTGALTNERDIDDDQNFSTYKSLEQIDKELITLSIGPRNKMNMLRNLDIIKQRSKPAEAPKKPEQAPFFLQLKGAGVGDDASGREGIAYETPEQILANESEVQKQTDAIDEVTKFKPTGRVGFESKFTRLLREGGASGDYGLFLEYLLSLSVGGIDLEIRSLNSFEPFDEISWFISAVTTGLESNKNSEMYDAFMNVLFKVHGDVIHMNAKDEKIKEALANWEIAHEPKERLDDIIKFCSSVINFVSTT